MSSLYEIKGEYLELLSYADSGNPDDEQLFLDTLESIQGELEVKADNYAAVIKEIEGSVDKFSKEIKRLTSAKEIMENHIKVMKARLLDAMQTMDVKEIKGEHFKLKIQNNGGKQGIEYTGDVPDSFKRVVYEDDTEKIRKALEDGEELGFAHLKPRGQHIRIQ